MASGQSQASEYFMNAGNDFLVFATVVYLAEVYAILMGE
jgi:hypothetical protein